MKLRAFGRTDVGQVRKNNEDNLLVGWPIDPGIGVFVVADGVGGESHGEVASEMFAREAGRRIAAESQRFAAYDPNTDDQREPLLKLLSDLVVQVNRRIYTLAQQDPNLTGMCTTGVVLVMVNGGAFIAHAGDSRLYLIRGQHTYQLTEDHTLANQLVRSGALRTEDLKDFVYSNVITRSFGKNPHVDVDTLFVEAIPGDRFILCSDGLHGYVEGDELRTLSAGYAEPEGLAHRLIDEANRRGGSDNITAIVAEVQPEARPDHSTAVIDLGRKLEVLRQLFLFKDLTDQELIRVMRVIYTVRKSAGEVIIQEQTSGDELYILFEGLVDVTLEGRYLTSIAPGNHFGELALIDDYFRSASITAKTDVLLLTIQRKDFVEAIQEDPEIARKLLWSFLENLTGRVRDLSFEVVELKQQLAQARGNG